MIRKQKSKKVLQRGENEKFEKHGVDSFANWGIPKLIPF